MAKTTEILLSNIPQRATSNALQAIDHKLLAALEVNARISNAELARRLGISPTAVAERINRLQDAGVIQQYRTIINPAAVNRSISAIVEVSPFGPDFEGLVDHIKHLREVVHCFRVTGTAFLIMLIRVSSGDHLNRFLMGLTNICQTKTSIVLNIEAEDRPLLAEPALAHRLSPGEA